MVSVEPSVGRESGTMSWPDSGVQSAGRSLLAGTLRGPRWNHPMAETAELEASEAGTGRWRGLSLSTKGLTETFHSVEDCMCVTERTYEEGER